MRLIYKGSDLEKPLVEVIAIVKEEAASTLCTMGSIARLADPVIGKVEFDAC